MKLEEKRERSGRRLDECLRMRKMTASEIANLSAEERETSLSESYISQMRRGVRSITHKNAMLFADYLDIDPGYLLGDDDFKAKSYTDYEKTKDLKEKVIPRHTEKWRHYSYYLRPVGARIVNLVTVDPPEGDTDSDDMQDGFVRILLNKNRADISFKEMDDFHADIESYIKTALAHMMKKHEHDGKGKVPSIEIEVQLGKPKNNNDEDR